MTMKTNNRILVVPGIGEIKSFFDDNYYRPDKEAVHSALIAGAFADYASGSMADIENGMIVCNYNPVTQDPNDALRGANRIVEVIESSA